MKDSVRALLRTRIMHHDASIFRNRFTLRNLGWRGTCAAVAVAALGASGCGGGDEQQAATPAETRQYISDNVPNIVDSMTLSLEEWNSDPKFTQMDEHFAQLSSSFERLFPMVAAEGDEFVALAQAVAAEDGLEDEPSLADAIEDTAGIVFSDDNYEGEGIYRLSGALVCGELIMSQTEAGETDSEIDPDCVSEIDEIELRLRATKVGGALELGVRIGPNQDEPLVLTLGERFVRMSIDLAEAKEAIAFLSADDAAELPAVMEGVFSLSLETPAADEVALRMSIDEAVRFESAPGEGQERVRVETAATEALYLLEASPRGLFLSYGLGRTQFTGPWSAFSDEGTGLGELKIDWQGLSYRLELTGESDELTVRDIGLGNGSSTVTLDGKTLVAVDLNADSGRHFDLGFGFDDSGAGYIDIEPGLDLEVQYDFALLSEAGVFIDSPLEQAGYRLQVRGDAPRLRALEADPLLGTGGGVEVLAGELVITADGYDGELLVPAGQCLVELAEAEADAHPLIGALAVSDCAPSAALR
ncbi:hypothetical protein Hoch_0276 [Haliangium ochraceum DSM 14365]|uniref:Uncharacterized protein n=2 Tax=Haliangium ochraceum TaxID=80816 RepID=D0LHQ5_HALO1|nr:hypothetical protein Hoch_0276 [Haliangium ochraceum DSM 14365]